MVENELELIKCSECSENREQEKIFYLNGKAICWFCKEKKKLDPEIYGNKK